MQLATTASHFLILLIMKKLSRSEMKNVMGGINAEPGCGQYEGQTTWICGWTGGPANTNCTIDICFCDGRPPVCDYPRPCDVQP